MASRKKPSAPRSENRQSDEFDRILELDKAAAVMLRSTGIVSSKVAKAIAETVTTFAERCAAPGANRPNDYLAVEHALIDIGGLDAGRVHTGRSRVDLTRTTRRMAQRESCLAAYAALLTLREHMLALGEAHAEALVPGYTMGVQAQPTSFGHYISGYVAGLERAAERLKTLMANINRSPIGVAALGTSSFPMDRQMLSDLLGFDEPIDNSFDAAHVSPLDTGMEIVGTALTTAMTIGLFIGDLERQYRFPTPWLTLTPGALMGISTLMPQKRNPDAVNQVRVAISDLGGIAMAYELKAHKTTHGLTDYTWDDGNRALRQLEAIIKDTATLVASLRFNEARALEEIRNDYGTTTELVSTLQRADVPLPLGHEFVSKLVDYGRGRGLKADELPFKAAAELYAKAAAASGYEGATIPLDEDGFRKALTAREMVRRARGLGGPQPSEVKRLLGENRKRLARDRAWEKTRRAGLAAAHDKLDKRFARLRGGR